MIINNLAENFGVLADTVEVLFALVLMLGGIWLTYRIQKWADRAGDAPAAANQGMSGAAERYEPHGMRR